VATAVLFSSAFPAMFGTFVKYQFQRTYDAILAAPVDTEELVTAEALWIATRAGVYGCVPMLVAIAFGLDPSWGMFAVPLIAWVSGFGWACFGIMISGFAKSFENFNYVVSAVLTPLFLVAGTFFPISNLPGWAQLLANFNPLHHCVELVRHAAFGFQLWDVGRLGALVHHGYGFTGNGVGPSYLGGEILARLALDRRDELTRLAIVEPDRKLFPPEPLRWAGGSVIRSALVRRDAAEDVGRSADPVTALIASLPRLLGLHLPR